MSPPNWAWALAVSLGAASARGQGLFRTSHDAAFLSRGWVARSSGMGEAASAWEDGPFSVFGNPAALGPQEERAYGLSYESLDQGTLQSGLCAAIPLRTMRLGLGGGIFSPGAFEARDEQGNYLGLRHPLDGFAAAAAAWALPRSFRLKGWTGASLEWVGRAEAPPLGGLGLGGLVRIDSRMDLGLAFSHLGLLQGKASLPGLARAGLVHRVLPRLTLAADLALPLSGERPWVGMGLEAQPVLGLKLRLGYRLNPEDEGLGALAGLSLGLGFSLGATRLDYALRSFGNFATSHNLSLSQSSGPRSPAAPEAAPSAAAPPVEAAPGPIFLSGTGAEQLQAENPAARPSRDPEPPRAPKAEALPRLEQAQKLFDQGRFDQALALCLRIQEKSPEQGRVWELSGYCRQELGDKEGALRAFKKALELDPKNVELDTWVEELSRTEAGSP